MARTTGHTQGCAGGEGWTCLSDQLLADLFAEVMLESVGVSPPQNDGAEVGWLFETSLDGEARELDVEARELESGGAEGARGAPSAASGEVDPDTLPDPFATGGEMMQYTFCPHSGRVFAKPLVGRFRDEGGGELRARMETARSLLTALGGQPEVDRRQALWQQVEFLDNVLEFELLRPCGCPQPHGGAGPAQEA